MLDTTKLKIEQFRREEAKKNEVIMNLNGEQKQIKSVRNWKRRIPAFV